MNDRGLGQKAGQLNAAGGVLLNDLYRDAGAQQQPGQVQAHAAAAHDHGLAHGVGADLQVLHEAGQIVRLGGHMDVVALPQHVAAVGDQRLAAPGHSAHQHLDPGDLVHLAEGNAHQPGAGLHLQLHQLGAPLCKGIPFDEGGNLQNAVHLARHRQLRVHRHGKAQFFPHGKLLFNVLRVAHPGNGMDLRVHLPGGQATQQIGLVRTGGRNDQIRLLHVGGAQRAHGGRVSLHHHHIVPAHAVIQHLLFGVDDRQVVSLAGKFSGDRKAHLAVPCHNDLHSLFKAPFSQAAKQPPPLR